MSFGFNLTGPHTQIAIAMVGGVLILPFSISSIFTLIHSNKWSGIAASIGFALMFVMQLLYYYRFHVEFHLISCCMIVTPSVITVANNCGLQMYYEKKKKNKKDRD